MLKALPGPGGRPNERTASPRAPAEAAPSPSPAPNTSPQAAAYKVDLSDFSPLPRRASLEIKGQRAGAAEEHADDAERQSLLHGRDAGERDKDRRAAWACCRDLALFAAGVLASALLLYGWSSMRSGGHEGALKTCGGGAGREPDVTTHATFDSGPGIWHVSSNLVSRYAFVMMAYDAPNKTQNFIWMALAMARALQRLSRYPLILLTNTTHFPDGQNIFYPLQRLNVQVLPVYNIPIPAGIGSQLNSWWHVPFWKLQIWGLTQFEKLIWLDADAILVRSIDWLFERAPMWGQRDIWACNASRSHQNWLCSGLMLLEPSKDTYEGLMQYASNTSGKWWENGDQKLINDYFKDVLHRPVQLLEPVEASFGKCIDHVQSVFHAPHSQWSMPAFVHKSSAHNECFYFDVAEQLAEVNGDMVNICHYHPLGPYWRDQFCDALHIIGVEMEAATKFCDDDQWYKQA